MTRRAARMLAALEDGCETREEIFAHAGGFFLCNNAASDLRRAGVQVVWDRDTDTYHLLDEPDRPSYPPSSEVGLVEQDNGWMALDVGDAEPTGGPSAAVADTALTAYATVRTHGSGTAVLSETVGERQGRHLPSAEHPLGEAA